MPFDTEDKNPSLGDPSTQSTTPLTQKQMQGAQKATVNRTQLPADRHGVPHAGEPAPTGEPEKPQNGQTDTSDLGNTLTGSAGAVGSGLQQAEQTYRAEADNAIGLNPAHGQDWWKHALEAPVETYFMGKHIYSAFYNAFLDPTAEQTSVHDIWHQDNAVGWLMRNVGANPLSEQVDKRLFGQTPETVSAEGTSMVLPTTADPTNLLYAGPGARGVMLVGKFLAPGAVNAIFTDRHGPSDLAWAVMPAMLFGGKLPPSVSRAVEKVAPGALKVFDKLNAAKMAQDANKVGVQDREKMLQDVLQQGALGAKNEVVAKAWERGEQALTKAQELALGRTLMDRYGTLDADKVISQMVREGMSPRSLQKVWTKLYRMPYDLVHVAPEEAALVDPRQHMNTLPSAIQAKVRDGFQWTAHMINQSHLGTAGHDVDPAVSRFRSLLGMQTTDKLVEDMWSQHLKDVAGKQGDDPHEQDLLSRALESGGREAEVAYQSLSAEMKYVRDSMRLVAAGVGQSAQDAGMIERVHNYWPRVGLVVKDASGGVRPLRRAPRVLTGEPTVHRALAVRSVDLLTESRMQIEQAYKTVKEANAAVGRQREYVTQAILNGTPWHEIAGATGAGIPASDRTLIEQLQAAAKDSPTEVRTQAEDYAKRLIPEFSENPFDGIGKLGSQLRAITSRNAINDLLNATGKNGKALAIEAPRNDRARDLARAQGYKSLNVPGFGHVMVDAQYGKLLEDATKAKNLGQLQKLADLENKAVSMIMYSPRIHGMNMAARLGIAFVMHSGEVSRWFAEGLMQKGGLSQLGLRGVTQIGGDEMRMIPRRYGLVPPNPHLPATGMWGDSALAQAGKLFGDADIGRIPLARDMANSSEIAKASSGAKQVLGAVKDILWGKQSDLWSWVSDFGNMMWWIEYASAQRGGMLGARLGGEEAARYATARANSWMGHVAPNDWNPNLHAALKTVAFAPNWWRTWGELLTGYYRNQGFGWSRDTIKYVVENEIKTAMAAVLFQQMSANVLNMVFSGHTIYQNDPGNWGKIEITAPWALEMLNATVLRGNAIDAKTGRDAKGAKLTWENPLARQMVDTEQLMGLLTSAPNWSPDTLRQGFSSFAAARTSPVAQAIAALGNVDLYRSIAADGLRYVDPNADTLGGNPFADLLTAGGDLTPFSSWTQQIQQQIMQGNVAEVQGPFGLPIPKAVTDAFSPGQLAQDAAKTALVGLTGTNPPFMRSSKTQGVSPTDDQYKAVHEIQSKYEQQMNSLSTSTLSGQLAPYQWLATYRQLSAKHSAEMQAIFLHAPEYHNGPLGLTGSWENLYDQATDKNGVLQPDKLRSLQQQWRSEHSAADYAAVRSELRGNDAKYPTLALYHKTLDAYDNWQADWCTQSGVDRSQLQSDLAGYAAVYNDRTASAAWLRDHPEITQFESAKKTEFESGQSSYGEAGLMYALFFNPTAADRYLTTSGETAQEVEQAVEQQQVPAAP